MFSRSLLKRASALVFVCLGAAPVLSAQSRFEAVTRDAVSGIPGLQAVIIRDNVLHTCYTAFVVEGSPPIANGAPTESSNLQAAAAARDRQLEDLSATFEGAVWNQIPGTPNPNPLRYQWEATKIQDAFNLTVLDQEITRLERRLERIVDQPRVVSVSPVQCSTAAGGRTP
jgi:hypothetical protein